MNVSKVQVLLSTYNGEKYLKEQLDSLLAQDYPNIDILIRDDGSKDSTKQILTGYENHKNISVIYGSNIGVTASFLELLKISDPKAEFFAFCDQDDVWLKDKISRAVAALQKHPSDIPLMYCSRFTIVDEALRIMGYSKSPRKELSFNNALCQNVIPGCTMIINRIAKKRVIDMPMVIDRIVMHDAWLYLVVSAFGSIVYDDQSRILYRQHGANVCGEQVNLAEKFLIKVKRFFRRERFKSKIFADQAVEFRRLYGAQLSPQNAKLLEDFIESRKTFTQRLWYAIKGETYRQSLIDDALYKLLIIVNLV